MRSSEALVLAVVAAILVVAAVVLYSLVAQKMYAKDRQLAKRHQEPAAPEKTSDNPK
jgi:cytochrome c-type biogenesis protein CcmH/NrfG